ncbi:MULTISPECIES: hypothetical protein [unclassified Pseudoclavibacter]|uniref:hypothetical protein n=1 Tax=unclassified Pseudoclavibacter TaxID=2615177 RepID=UPI0011B08F6D|nr:MULTISPECIES: hypothetical protein [unclassified Pseudoclavibacter]
MQAEAACDDACNHVGLKENLRHMLRIAFQRDRLEDRPRLIPGYQPPLRERRKVLGVSTVALNPVRGTIRHDHTVWPEWCVELQRGITADHQTRESRQHQRRPEVDEVRDEGDDKRCAARHIRSERDVVAPITETREELEDIVPESRCELLGILVRSPVPGNACYLWIFAVEVPIAIVHADLDFPSG